MGTPRAGTCQQCGNPMTIPGHVRVKKWCSSKCRRTSRSENDRKRPLPTRTGTCQQCGNPMTIPGHIKIKKWCSLRCKDTAASWLYPHLFVRVGPRNITSVCQSCGIEFTYEYHSGHERKYCNNKCGQRKRDQGQYRRRKLRMIQKTKDAIQQ